MQTRNRPHTKESLLALAKPEGDCQIWQSTKRSNGYGVATYKGKQTTAHRVMFQVHHGVELSSELEVDHICSNRACINPLHLEAVSHAENMKRGLERRLTCRAGHPWDEQNTYTTEVKRKQGGVRYQRFCRVCRAKHQADLRLRNNKGGLHQ